MQMYALFGLWSMGDVQAALKHEQYEVVSIKR